MPLADKHGNVVTEIPIRKGERIIDPSCPSLGLTLHTEKSVWGEDTLDFKYARKVARRIAAVPGVWSHLLTFLGDSHACIGYRFLLVKMKALMFTLIRTFEFELAVPAEDIVPFGMFLQRPALRNSKDEGAQFPLLVRPSRRI